MGTALIIDDNTMNLSTLRLLLEKEGLNTVTLINPGHLESILGDLEDIQVMFLDLEFPNHSGFELVSEFKAMPQFDGVPIIAYSVHISELNEVRAAGFEGFIGKPLDVHKFPEQLEAILSGEKIWDVGQ